MEKQGNYHEQYDSFYQSAAWRRVRNIKFAQARGLCERCLAKGIVREGREVHHIIPIDVDWNRRLDITNLELLCGECHNQGHGRISPLTRFNDFWEAMDDGGAGAEIKCGQGTASQQQRPCGAGIIDSDLSASGISPAEGIDKGRT